MAIFTHARSFAWQTTPGFPAITNGKKGKRKYKSFKKDLK